MLEESIEGGIFRPSGQYPGLSQPPTASQVLCRAILDRKCYWPLTRSWLPCIGLSDLCLSWKTAKVHTQVLWEARASASLPFAVSPVFCVTGGTVGMKT